MPVIPVLYTTNPSIPCNASLSRSVLKSQVSWGYGPSRKLLSLCDIWSWKSANDCYVSCLESHRLRTSQSWSLQATLITCQVALANLLSDLDLRPPP